jgi:hypothetical protein
LALGVFRVGVAALTTTAGAGAISFGALSVSFFAPPSGSSHQSNIATIRTAPMMMIKLLDNVFLPRKPKKYAVQLGQNMHAGNC